MNASLTVIVPTYNRAEFVGDTVASLLTQGTLVPEVIVVDDGSTDDTARALARFGGSIQYVCQENAGAAAARNTGITRAHGDLIAFRDSDDLCQARSLDRLVSVLTADPSIDLVVGRTQALVRGVGADGAVVYVPTGAAIAMRSLSATVIRRAALARIGTFDERLRIGEDDDWFMRAEELAMRIVFDPATCQLRRLHDTNLTRDQEARQHALLGLLKNRLDRGRADSGHDLTRSRDGGPTPP